MSASLARHDTLFGMKQDPISKPVKMLVTHINPDMDAITSVWLFERFGGTYFAGAEKYFVVAGSEVADDVLHAKEIDPDEVVHVDTGMGVFDHHQPGHTERDSATLLVWQYLTKKHAELQSDEALKRLVLFVNELDHFAECWWPEANNDRYTFMLDDVLKGLRSAKHFNDHELVDFGMICLDGVYNSFKIKVGAEKDIAELGQEFETTWGKALAIENQNDEVMKIAQKMGYMVVVRKDAEQGHVRIKAVPDREIDLKEVYDKVKDFDEEGTWFYHPSGTMVINGSKKHSGQVPTPMSLEEIVEVLKSIS